MDLDRDISNLSIEDLLAYQQEMTRLRLEAIAAGRRAQVEIDKRAERIAERRREEDALLGQVSKPPTQDLLAPTPAGTEERAGSGKPVSGILREG